ncbi:sialate O-acetylesterase [Algibacter sp.]|uniref:sialate O-acetylesterase n=1 Tax=Algibacter sp. TaxID=1872428 RepID=UPI003C7631D5
MKNRLGLFIIVATLINIYGCKSYITNSEKDNVQVVLLAGQSNMAGAGNYDELSDEIKKRIEKVAHRVLLSQSNVSQKPLSYYINKPSEKYNFTKRFGPELLLGLTLAEKYPNKEFLLIKHAKGGTALYGAWNPEWTIEKAKEIEKGEKKQNWNLPEIHIDLIKSNLEILKKKSKSYQIIGMAWMQGENDAGLDVAANSYAKNLKKLIEKYRTEFNETNMPFVFGQINSRYGIEGGAEIVRNQMEKVPQMLKQVSLIKTTTKENWLDFPKHSDNVHYNTEGQKRLGITLGKELLKLMK